MARKPGQGPTADEKDRENALLMRKRAQGNVDRPRVRNRNILLHLAELIKLYSEDVLDAARDEASNGSRRKSA